MSQRNTKISGFVYSRLLLLTTRSHDLRHENEATLFLIFNDCHLFVFSVVVITNNTADWKCGRRTTLKSF